MSVEEIKEKLAAISEGDWHKDWHEARRATVLMLFSEGSPKKAAELLHKGTRAEICEHYHGEIESILNALGDKWDALIEAARLKSDVLLIAEPLGTVLTNILPMLDNNNMRNASMFSLMAMMGMGCADPYKE